MTKIVIETRNGKILGVYGSEPIDVHVYDNVDLNNLTDEQLDEMDAVAATVPYVAAI